MAVVSESTYYTDSRFSLTQIPAWRAKWYKFLFVDFWGNLPSTFQRKFSAWYASIYDLPISKSIIGPYIRLNYSNKNYLDQFKPPSGKPNFDSFQDFFIREFREPPSNKSSCVWPCEGLLCHVGRVGEIGPVAVKADVRNVATIFGAQNFTIPNDYCFTNVFLHNKNYHRIHAPVQGTISRIQHIPGDLIILRPWFHSSNPSLPAFRNERYNVDITDEEGKVWYLSIVGGPAVGTIELAEGLIVGKKVSKLEELALFYLGSTCCMASPEAPKIHRRNNFVAVGATY